MRKAGRVLAVACLVLTARIDSLRSTAEGFQALPTTVTSLKHTIPAIHSQRPSSLFHRFNPLRINPDGSTTTTKKKKKTATKVSQTPTPLGAPTAIEGAWDISATFKYILAIVVQMTLVTLLFQGLDKLVVPRVRVPFFINAFCMYFLALKSRVFNPLSNRRPKPQTKEIQGVTQRKMPSWTPPGVVFPIVWLLVIGPLRAVTSAIIIKASGGIYASKALMSLVLHLSIGDVWNTVNNVERRYGTSVLGVLCVWLSAAFAAWQFSLVVPLAGRLLSLKLIWLTIATSLVVRTWQLNPDPSTGRIAPLLPTKGDGITKFEWF